MVLKKMVFQALSTLNNRKPQGSEEYTLRNASVKTSELMWKKIALQCRVCNLGAGQDVTFSCSMAEP